MNQETIENILFNVKMILGISDTEKDELIKYHIKSALNKIFNYCHIKELPDGLIEVATELSVKMYNGFNAVGGGATSSGAVSSISRGDFSISYDTSKEDTGNAVGFTNNDLLIDYKQQLNAYRKMRLLG